MENLTFDFILSQDITFQYKGDTVEAKLLTLKAPSAKNMKRVVQLQAGFSASLKSLQSQISEKEKEDAIKQAASKTDDEKKFKGSEVMDLIKIAGAIELEHYYDTFKRLLCSENPVVCTVDDKLGMIENIYDQILFTDLENLLGEYLANFLV